MDLICTCCGEPWDIDHVLHEEPEGFDRQGGRIRACPCCHGVPPEGHSEGERERLAAVAAVAELLGDDVDGVAATLEDLDLT
jgi:hypothetical protein